MVVLRINLFYVNCFYPPNHLICRDIRFTFCFTMLEINWSSFYILHLSNILTFYRHGEAARDLAARFGASSGIRDTAAPPCERRSICRVSRRQRHPEVERLSESRLAPYDVGCSTSCLYCHVGRTVRHRRTLAICNYRIQLCGRRRNDTFLQFMNNLFCDTQTISLENTQ